jgi:DNA-binding NtrC family response regulator
MKIAYWMVLKTHFPFPGPLEQLRYMDQEKIILFAEPEGVTSADLHPLLTEKGHSLIVAKTLKETLLTLQDQRVDALVLDAALLEEDCGFISVIKGIEKDLPIIICAESNTPELESKIRKQKIFYYHIKSFGIEDLEMAISNAVKV